MSLFKYERAKLLKLTLEQGTPPSKNTISVGLLSEGDVFNDGTQKSLAWSTNGMTIYPEGVVNANSTAVTNTNATVATNLMAGYTFPAGALNVVGKAVEFHAGGTYNLAASSTNVFTLKLGAVTLGTFTSGSNANTSVTLPWALDATFITVTTGASGVVEFDGVLNIDIGATAVIALSSYGVVGASSAVDLTASALLQLQSNLGSGNASSTQIQRVQLIKVAN